MTGALEDASRRPEGDERKRRDRDALYTAYVRELEAAGRPSVVSYEELRVALADYKVVVLGGYSGRGYAHPEVVRERIGALVEANGDRTAYLLGATAEGIGRAYEWIPETATELGLTDVKTAGIVSRNAAEIGVAAQDWVVFVDTPVDSWEVEVEGRSLMVSIAAETGGEMVYFGGGEVSRAEIGEALERGVPVTLYGGEGTAPGEDSEDGADEDGTASLVESPPPGLDVVIIIPPD